MVGIPMVRIVVILLVGTLTLNAQEVVPPSSETSTVSAANPMYVIYEPVANELPLKPSVRVLNNEQAFQPSQKVIDLLPPDAGKARPCRTGRSTCYSIFQRSLATVSVSRGVTEQEVAEATSLYQLLRDLPKSLNDCIAEYEKMCSKVVEVTPKADFERYSRQVEQVRKGLEQLPQRILNEEAAEILKTQIRDELALEVNRLRDEVRVLRDELAALKSTSPK